MNFIARSFAAIVAVLRLTFGGQPAAAPISSHLVLRAGVAAGSCMLLINVSVAGDPSTQKSDTLAFESVSIREGGDIQLANGFVALDKVLWQAVLVAPINEHAAWCTGTLIGPQVLLTAAHCVDARSSDKSKTLPITVRVAVGSPPTQGSCNMHPAYAASSVPIDDTPRNSNDYALCELSNVVTVILEESLDDGPDLNAGQSLLMTGFGCSAIRVENGRIVADRDGENKLRLGTDVIEAAHVLNEGQVSGAYVRTKATGTQPILCPGDSGGPAFKGIGITPLPNEKRRLSAVNSKVTAVPAAEGYIYLSFMAPVTSPSFKGFLQNWVGTNAKRVVCGFNVKAGSKGCRS